MKLYKYIENPWGKFIIHTTELNLATIIADSFSLENSNYIFDKDIRILKYLFYPEIDVWKYFGNS